MPSNEDLARLVFVTPQTVYGVVRGREGAGWIEHSRGAGRTAEIRLTEAGSEALAQGHRAAAEVERRMTAGLSRANVKATKASLPECGNALEVALYLEKVG